MDNLFTQCKQVSFQVRLISPPCDALHVLHYFARSAVEAEAASCPGWAAFPAWA